MRFSKRCGRRKTIPPIRTVDNFIVEAAQKDRRRLQESQAHPDHIRCGIQAQPMNTLRGTPGYSCITPAHCARWLRRQAMVPAFLRVYPQAFSPSCWWATYSTPNSRRGRRGPLLAFPSLPVRSCGLISFRRFFSSRAGLCSHGGLPEQCHRRRGAGSDPVQSGVSVAHLRSPSSLGSSSSRHGSDSPVVAPKSSWRSWG